MELQSTKGLTQQEFEAFFCDQIPNFNQEEMKKYGYFLYKEHSPTAFFSLVPVDSNAYWLRMLVMKRSPSAMLPVTIIQAAEKLTKNFGATNLFIHSKTETLNQLLLQLGYTSTDQTLDPLIEADWWITSLASVDNQQIYSQ
ncbi:hypothetical protein [Gracilibacillus kekensis]|uniref:N-acetyltransferase domain-containing protein n=1 Tax=Gracilibacillus kekensis TaxID=1027249 RepID=A0A1M7KC51_9BACI|nr:hypothetical protein [Gracilibacillus kekensis]SHM62563.1 hypothetical protein SAMN05216179_0642 [Gracilibacillus kekensis]